MIDPESWAPSCPLCEAALATVKLETDEGTVRMCAQCARTLSALLILSGKESRVRPALRLVSGPQTST